MFIQKLLENKQDNLQPRCKQKNHSNVSQICTNIDDPNYLKILCIEYGSNIKTIKINDFLKDLADQIYQQQAQTNQFQVKQDEIKQLENDLIQINQNIDKKIIFLQEQKKIANRLQEKLNKEIQSFKIIPSSFIENTIEELLQTEQIIDENFLQNKIDSIIPFLEPQPDNIKLKIKKFETHDFGNFIEESIYHSEYWKQCFSILDKIFFEIPTFQNNKVQPYTEEIKKDILQDIQNLVYKNNQIFQPIEHKYLFIQELKHQDLQFDNTNLIQNKLQDQFNSIIKKTANLSIGYSIALAYPFLNQIQRSFVTFKIIQGSEWTAVGICQKNKALQNHFILEFNSNSGSYLIQANGNAIVNGKGVVSDYSFKFKNGDIIICDYCPFRKYVKFEKVGKREKVTIPLSGSTQEMCFAVRLDKLHESIQIINFYN